MKNKDDTTSELVGHIYDAVDNPDGWALFLNRLTNSFGTHSARLRMVDLKNDRHNLVSSAGYDESFDKLYVEHYAKIDPWIPLMERAGVGVMGGSYEHISDKAMLSNQCYNEFYRNFDLFYGLGGHVIKMDRYVARIGVQRSHKSGPFSDNHKQALQSLVPHLQRAFRLSMHFDSVHSTLHGAQDALYFLPTPLMLLDEYGKVAFVNQRAESILNSSKAFSVSSKRLTATDETVHEQIKQATKQVIRVSMGQGIHCANGVRFVDYQRGTFINLIMTPYPARSVTYLGLNSRICAAVFIQDGSENGEFPSGLLQSLYGLTSAEVRLAKGLLDGLTPAELATRFRVKIATIRTQLRSLFAKTGTSGQVEVVRLLTNLMARV